MTDRPDNSTRKDTEGPGAQLRRARESRGLVLRDVAQELHLDEYMLQALEDDDFAALGAPVFAKGHMRKYGSMLGLNTDDLMVAYYRKRGRDDSPPPITKTMAPEPAGSRFSWKGLGWVLAALVALIVLYLIWAILQRGLDRQIVESTPVQPSFVAEEPAAEPAAAPAETLSLVIADSGPDEAGQPATGPAAAAVDDISADATVPVTAESSGGVTGQQSASGNVNTQPVTVSEVATTTSNIQLRLSFSGESWVEVTDSDGRQLVYDMMAAGRTRTVSGQPPIEVFLGNSRSVQVEVDGQFYPIPRRAIRGNTARFVIEAGS